MQGVLQGIRVLDLSRVIAGPYCAMLMADMGAEVIRIERPGGDDDRRAGALLPDGHSVPMVNMGRNKKGITLNLQSDKGKEILKALVKLADVVIESFGLEAKEAMGVGYESLSSVNRAIVLVSISGYGQTGPHARRLCFDPIAQAMSGAMSLTGFPGDPPTRSAVTWVDYCTGVHAAFGAMLALFHREHTGRGQLVDVALLDVAISAMGGTGAAAEYKLMGYIRPQLGNLSYRCYANAFHARDGWVFISGVFDGIWKRLVRAIGKPEIISDPRFQSDNSRYEHSKDIDPLVSDWVKHRTVDEVIAILEQNRVPCGRINSIAEVVADPQVRAREMLVDVEWPGVGSVPITGVPIKLSETPGKVTARAPLVGEHNTAVYEELLGYGPDRLSKLAEEGII